jgi:predicted ATP-dependent protease
MKAILAIVLSLGIAIPVPVHSAGILARGQTAPKVTVTGSAAGAINLKLNVPSVTKGGTFSAPALLGAVDQNGSPKVQVQAHPVIDLLHNYKTQGLNLPDAAITRADAAEVMKIAATMPQGKLREQMMVLAKTAELNASGGAGEVYDNSAASEDSPIVPAVSGAEKFWGLVAKVPGLKSWASARAESGRPKGLRPARVLKAEQVRYVPSPSLLPKNGTVDIPLADKKIVGQEMAEQAFLFGAKMPGDNYNIYVSGPDGSGRETMVRQVLEKMAPQMATPNDIVAATNFENDEKPVILELKPGQGEAFKGAVSRFVMTMQRVLPQILASGEAAAAKKQLHTAYEVAAAERREALSTELAATPLTEDGFGVELVMEDEGHGPSSEPYFAITHQGKIVSPEELADKIKSGAFTQADWDRAVAALQQIYDEINAKVQEMLNANAEEHAAVHQKMEKIDSGMAATVAQQLGAQITGALSGSVEGDAEHVALHERDDKRMAEINADAAQHIVNGFGFEVGFVPTEQGMMLSLSFTYQGKTLTREILSSLIEAGTVTEAAFAEAQRQLAELSKPYQKRATEAYKLFNKEHQAIHANAPKPSPEAVAYVQKLISHVAANYPIFLGALSQKGGEDDGVKQIGKQDEPADFYRVSVLVNNADLKGAPVVWEKNPTYENLFGYADSNDRTMLIQGAGLMKAKGAGGPTLKAGSYLKARGGFLVLNVMDVLREPGAWQALMAAVKTGEAEISEGGLMGLATMKGDKYFVPGKTKVILIGAPMIKMLLQHHDEDFGRNFNVTSEFEPSLTINNNTINGYLYFIKKIVAQSAGEIMDLSQDAISSVIEFSARLVDSNKKLTAQFGVLYGLLREASFWAAQSGGKVITTSDLNNALIARDQRENVYQRHMKELYHENIFTVQTQGGKAGQINGLAVMGAFGVPMRITVINGAGAFDIISADQNAGTTGSSFDKSLEVSKGFITYAMGPKRKPKGSIRVSFEQNYGGIDGDSATSTMLYAILSSLSGVKIKQNMAVTGSADQFGTVQAIGGVNEKVEGFFDLVASKNQLNTQDPPTVLVPSTNVRDLQLRPDVVEAIRQGTFRVIAIDNVMQGVEQLTGVPYADIMAKVGKRMDSMN